MPVVVQSRFMNASVDLLRLHEMFPQRYSCLLSSVFDHNDAHRYDILFAELVPVDLSVLNDIDLSKQVAHDSLPFVGGYVVFFPYEYAQQIEPTLALPISSLTAQVWSVSAAFIWDRETQQLSAVAQPENAHWCDQLWLDWDASSLLNASSAQPPSLGNYTLTEDVPENFLQGVAQCRAYILAGDVFQVNLSRQWQANFEHPIAPVSVYSRLRASNPAPFSALLTQPDWAIISSSPERLLRVKNGIIDTRPIAGTRRRGEDNDADIALRDELTLHPKEQAEHVMLLDLERNDLGRVCVPGSICVNELMAIESYTHVHHIVSNVQGVLKTGTSAIEAIHATFPGGTITGCPKVRCMEIIAELEQTARGVYTGSLGYVSLDGQMDVNILIRSFYWQPNQLTFRAGAGIVYDSIAQAELEETYHKAKGLIRALG